MTLTLLNPAPSVGAPRRKREAAPTALPVIAKTNSALVMKLLSRTRGATLAEIVVETGWLPHSARAWLSGLRRKERGLLVREARRSGDNCYRLVAAIVAEPVGAAATAGAGTSNEADTGRAA